MKTILMITIADGIQLGIDAGHVSTGSSDSELYRCITELKAKIDGFNSAVKPGSGPEKSLAELLSSVALFRQLHQDYIVSKAHIE